MDSKLHPMAKHWTIFTFLFGAFLLLSSISQAAGSGRIKIDTDKGAVIFNVQYAISVEEKAKGLMHRKSLPPKTGMLFIYQTPKEVSMWMKNTLIPLDMFFITQRGRIRHIKEKAQPGSLSQIHSGGKVMAVLELMGGSAETYGIKTGDQVSILE